MTTRRYRFMLEVVNAQGTSSSGRASHTRGGSIVVVILGVVLAVGAIALFSTGRPVNPVLLGLVVLALFVCGAVIARSPRVERRPSVVPNDRGRRDLRRAWLSVALLPAGFTGMYFVAKWVMRLQGYNLGEGPFRAAVLALIPGLLVLCASTASAVWFGRQARRHGRDSGLFPVLLAGVIGGGFLLLLAIAVLAHLFGLE